MDRRRSSIFGTVRVALGALAAVLLALAAPSRAEAEQASFRVYGAEPGLSELSGVCLAEDKVGFLYICTQHGLFSFDGRQFTGLGVDQGLPAARFVRDIALAPSGRLAVRYENDIRIADVPGSAQVPPTALRFQTLKGDVDLARSTHGLAPWQGGLALVDGSALRMIAVPAVGPASIQPLPLPPALRPGPGIDIKTVFAVNNALWMVRSDGDICVWNATPRCFGVPDGLPGALWLSIAAGPNGAIMARSPRLIATLARGATTWTTGTLPDQGTAYDNYREALGLFRTPTGSIMTQTEHGIAVLHDGQWDLVTTSEGVPKGIITASLIDRSGSLWLQSYGQGVARWVGYGGWQSLTHADGLLDGLAWETARVGDGSVWVTTDTGIDQIVQKDGRLSIGRHIAGAAYALGTNAGLLWSSDGEVGSRVIDPATGAERKLPIPPALAVVPGGARTTWMATSAGLYRCDGDSIAAIACTQVRPGLIRDMISDGSGGLYYLTSYKLRHRAADGTDTGVVEHWPVGSFAPAVIARGQASSIWVGGDGGLVRVWLRGTAPPLIEVVPQADLGSSNIASLLVDHRGWLWVGTNVGLSVFDAHRWVSLNTEDGLLSTDLDERGLREDPDGTIWITSSLGVSHLLRPEHVFAPQKLDVVISRASIDGRTIRDAQLPFNRKPLQIEVGTPAYSAQQSVTFRYRMSGVDDDWIETSNGRIFYPFVPPGRHKFEVFAYDLLKHRVSAPETLTIDIAYPWWRQWWAETLWSLAAAGVLYGAFQLRVQAERARQAELERRVEETTAEIRKAQAALAYQATHDQLTGLLNRSAVESRLAGFLLETSTVPNIVIGLVDIDHFKAINDGWGHLTGDSVLREMGALAGGILRAEEFAGRYGGEEILVVLRNGDGRAVSRLAEFHHRVRTHSFSKAGTPGILTVTCSVGMAAVFGGDTWETLIGRADRALYHAKRSGRDRIAGLAGSTGSHDADGMHERARSVDGT